MIDRVSSNHVEDDVIDFVETVGGLVHGTDATVLLGILFELSYTC